MLDDTELQQVQHIDVDGDQVLLRHGIPGLEGDFLQRLNRRASQVRLAGVLSGARAKDDLKTLRDKYRAGDPVSFVADISTATRVGEVLIQELNIRELAGKPERFEYAFLLREYQPPPPAPTPVTPEPPEPPDIPIEQQVGNLIVEVIVEGQPSYDYSRVTVSVQGTKRDGSNLPRRTLSNRADNVWTENNFPAGTFTAEAVAAADSLSGSTAAEVRPGETTRVTITLRPGTTIAHAFIIHFTFDRAFIEPCLMRVLRRATAYAGSHGDEKLVIVGHTDEVGPPDYNRSLGDRRARTVYAALTYGADPNAAVAEWDEIRRLRPAGETPSIHEGRGGWGIVEYQYMLQDLGFYPGNVDGRPGPMTDSAVRSFQQAQGLSVDGIVGDDTWRTLIQAYLNHYNLNLPSTQFLPNCEGEILKWLSCGEHMPLPDTPRPCSEPAWRPNRRTELLFVNATALPCPVPRPVTFDLPPPNGVGGGWCIPGPGDPNKPCCFVTRDSNERGKWLIQPAEAGELTVQGRLRFEDGTPAANVEYILIAPDGEYLHKGASGQADHKGEIICGANKGAPNPTRNRTDANGVFDYPEQTPVGVYTLEIRGPYVARAASNTSGACNGNVVCQHLDGSEIFDVIVFQLATTFDLQVTNAVQIGGASSTNYLALRAASEYVIVTAVFPTGSCAPPNSLTWSGGEGVPGAPLQRRVPRADVGQTTVTATLTSTGESKSVDIYVVRVTLDVDADRNGVVDEDEAGKNTWDFGPGNTGAIILCNNDNDNLPAGDTEIDNTNQVVDGTDDVDDLALLIIRQSGPLPPGVELRLTVDDQDRLRVFDPHSASGVPMIGPAPLPSESNPIVNSAAADAQLGMEAVQYPDTGFVGELNLTLILREGANELARDEVTVRVAPWTMSSHLDITEELYVVEDPGFNDAFVAEIAAAAAAAGVPVRRAPATGDIWIQDTMEIGYSRMPAKSTSAALNSVNPRGPRPSAGCTPRGGLNDYVADELLGPDYGIHEYPLSCQRNTFDSFGNLEVSPPVTVSGSGGDRQYRLGRIYYGRGRAGEEFNATIRQFLETQRVQSPFSINTNWLVVGHADEIVTFVPSNVGNDFRMLIASTDEAIRILTDLQTNVPGGGNLTLFTGKTQAYLRSIVPPTWDIDSFDHFQERTIDQILGDAALMANNTTCQHELNQVEQELIANLGSDIASNIIRIPSLFVEEPLFPGEFAALVPGMVNMLVVTRPVFSDTQLVMADPFGPIDPRTGEDALRRDVIDKLNLIGYADAQIRFADNFDTYHVRLGEVHCATNSKREPSPVPWWEQTDV